MSYNSYLGEGTNSMRLLKIVLIVTFIYSPNFVSQQVGIKRYQSFSGKIGLSLEGGATLTFSDFRTNNFDITARVLGEYFFPTTQTGAWGIRLYSGGGFLRGSNGTATRPQVESVKTTIYFVGGGAKYIIAFSKVVFPYAFAGVSYLYYDPRDLNGNRLYRNEHKEFSRHELMLNGELGLRFLFSDIVSFNISANIGYVRSDNIDDVKAGSDFDIFYSGYAGFTFYFGGTTDSDGDGVQDDDDICPNTLRNVIVDQFGCPVDIDKDGVPDYLDQCINTPVNIPVDTQGCPVDSDDDGIPDYLDLCKDTPKNTPVDARGCPLDEDKDGVPDYKDKCPHTPAGTEVDKWGCKSDKLSKEAILKLSTFVLTGGVIFDTGKSNLLQGAKTELDKIISIMKEYPETHWRIAGYTDNRGTYKKNKQLSLERAYSVADYLVQNGIDEARLESVGFGPDRPIADNSTATGRAMNRRVTIELLEE